MSEIKAVLERLEFNTTKMRILVRIIHGIMIIFQVKTPDNLCKAGEFNITKMRILVRIIYRMMIIFRQKSRQH